MQGRIFSKFVGHLGRWPAARRLGGGAVVIGEGRGNGQSARGGERREKSKGKGRRVTQWRKRKRRTKEDRSDSIG